MTERWQPGQLIARREILAFEPTNTVDRAVPWFGKCWLELPVRVVVDEPDELVLYVPPRSPFTFPPGNWPIAGGRHPWEGNTGWRGEGCLMVHRPGEDHAIWHFWTEPDRTFSHWYINLQTDFRRTSDAFETSDLELDFVIAPDHTWEIKDWDEIPVRVEEGRFSPELGTWIYDYGRDIIARLEAEGPWWDLDWVNWSPPAEW